MCVWHYGLVLLLTDLGELLEELGDCGGVLLDPGHLAPLLDQDLPHTYRKVSVPPLSC